MATNFPGSVDDAATVGDDTHPSADEALSSTDGGPAHHALHQNVGLAINAIEDKVGTGASTPAANTVLTGTGSGTSSWATVSTAMIGDDQVTQAKIADDAVGADQLAASAVVTASIVDDNVTQAKIAAGAVGTTELGADAVTGAKIANDAVAAEHLATDSVTADAIAAGAVGTAELAADAVTAAKIANNAVGNDQLIASPTFTTVTATNLAGTLTTAAQTNITSVGTLGSLSVTNAVSANNISLTAACSVGGTVSSSYASATTPSYNFTGDTNTGMYRSGADELSFATNGTQRVKITSGGTLQWINSSGIGGPLTDTSSTSGFRYVLQNQAFGTLQDYTSIRARKEQITNVTAADSGQWIDALQPVTFIERWLGEGDEPADNRTYREADVQVGFIADDVLSNSDTSLFAQATDNGEGGLDPAGWKWECVIAAAVAELKSVRARLAALEG